MFHVACTTTWVAEETKLENMKEQQEQMIQQDQFKKMNAQGTSRPARKTAKKADAWSSSFSTNSFWKNPLTDVLWEFAVENVPSMEYSPT